MSGGSLSFLQEDPDLRKLVRPIAAAVAHGFLLEAYG